MNSALVESNNGIRVRVVLSLDQNVAVNKHVSEQETPVFWCLAVVYTREPSQ